MKWPFVTRRRLDALQLQLDASRGNEAALFKLNGEMFQELCDAQIRAHSPTLAPAARALVFAASHTIDAAAALPELDGWKREHIDLEAALGELIAALEPFAVAKSGVNVILRGARTQPRRPA